jgi:hypothetical protein
MCDLVLGLRRGEVAGSCGTASTSGGRVVGWAAASADMELLHRACRPNLGPCAAAARHLRRRSGPAARQQAARQRIRFESWDRCGHNGVQYAGRTRNYWSTWRKSRGQRAAHHHPRRAGTCDAPRRRTSPRVAMRITSADFKVTMEVCHERRQRNSRRIETTRRGVGLELKGDAGARLSTEERILIWQRSATPFSPASRAINELQIRRNRQHCLAHQLARLSLISFMP